MPSPFDIQLDDMVRFEKDPVKETVQQEVDSQQEVGNRFTFDAGDTADQLASIFDAVRPEFESDPLSDDELGRARDLTRRSQRLQPLSKTDQPLSRRIPNNPFSIEIGPGLRNLASGLVNQERRRRREGDPERVDRATRRQGEIQSQLDRLASQHAATDDPDERRQIERRQRRLQRRADRQGRRAERYEGFEDELADLTRREQQAETAKEAERERLADRAEFVTGEVAEGFRDTRGAQLDALSEEQIHSNRIALEREKQKGQQTVERIRNIGKGQTASAQEKSEAVSAVNAYARTNMELAKTYDDEIKFIRDIMTKQTITDQRILPENERDPQIQQEYDHYNERIQDLQDSKEEVLQETMGIYESSSVLSEGTRVRRKPTKGQVELFQEYAEMGATEDQLRSMAEGMGVKFDAEALGLQRIEPEVPEGGWDADTVHQLYGYESQQDLVNYVMDEFDLNEQDAIRAIEAKAAEENQSRENIDSQDTELEEEAP